MQRGENANLSQDYLEMMVRGITGEPFIAEHIILPDGIVPLCDDPGLRMAVLTTLPMLDDMGMAARQLGGDPGRGVRISEARAVPPARRRSLLAAGRDVIGCNVETGPSSGSPPASARGLGTPGRGVPGLILLGGSPSPAAPVLPPRQPSPTPPQQEELPKLH